MSLKLYTLVPCLGVVSSYLCIAIDSLPCGSFMCIWWRQDDGCFLDRHHRSRLWMTTSQPAKATTRWRGRGFKDLSWITGQGFGTSGDFRLHSDRISQWHWDVFFGDLRGQGPELWLWTQWSFCPMTIHEPMVLSRFPINWSLGASKTVEGGNKRVTWWATNSAIRPKNGGYVLWMMRTSGESQ